jgi:hypothetical protein
MCGRYTLRTLWQRLAEHFGLRVTDVPERFVPRFNVAPTKQVLTRPTKCWPIPSPPTWTRRHEEPECLAGAGHRPADARRGVAASVSEQELTEVIGHLSGPAGVRKRGRIAGRTETKGRG